VNAVENRPVRILRIIARMNVGGPAWQVSVLTRGFNDDHRFESCLIVGDVGEGEADFRELRDPDLPVLRIPVLGRSVRPGDDIRALFAIRRAIRKFRPDIIHTHTTKAGLLGRIAAVACRVPIRVHTFHGHLLSGYFNRTVTYGVRLVEGFLAHRTTALVAVGERVRDELLEAGVGQIDQYVVIPPGVALTELPDRASTRAELDLPAEPPVVLFAGRITAIKRIDRLIEAMKLVLEKLPDTILAIAGEGDRLKETRDLAEPLGSSVRFLGWHQNMARLYAAADCMVLASDNEGMPVSLIEAAMAGVPSVTTDVGSAREVVVDGVTGLVVPADAVALAGGLVQLLSSSDRKKMGTAARNRALTTFAFERLINDHRVLYESLLTSHDHPNAT